MSPYNAAMARFAAHAVRHHQFFLLAARIFSRIKAETSEGDSTTLRCISEFEQRPWWEVCDTTPQDEDDSEEDIILHLKATLRKSYRLLKAALFPAEQGPAPVWFGLDRYANLVGLLRLNGHSVEVGSPASDFFQLVQTVMAPSDRAAVIEDLAPTVAAVVHRHQRRFRDGAAEAEAGAGAESDAEQGEADESDGDDEYDDELLNWFPVVGAAAWAPDDDQPRSPTLDVPDSDSEAGGLEKQHVDGSDGEQVCVCVFPLQPNPHIVFLNCKFLLWAVDILFNE